jgi:hypothetical protein
MKRSTKYSLTAVALAFGIASIGHADQDGKTCDSTTLRGSYMFAASGYNIIGGVAQPKAIVEVIDFNGDGALTVSGATRSLNGVITQIPPGGTGDYAVDQGCVGTLAFSGGPRFDIFVSPHGEKVAMIQTDMNTVLQGTATRLSH